MQFRTHSPAPLLLFYDFCRKRSRYLARPFQDLKLSYRPIELRSPIRDSLSGKKQFQKIILNATNRRGRQIKCYLAITPLLGSSTQGAVLMMADVERVNSMISTQEIEKRQQQE
ncbi:MAG: hypothetical protein V7K40_19185 [Nostoc sp.]|uniref:hypothetical protein n=1 Tax=Nostoc sp. TaxID=1180 RepID=UPI002FF5C694